MKTLTTFPRALRAPLLLGLTLALTINPGWSDHKDEETKSKTQRDAADRKTAKGETRHQEGLAKGTQLLGKSVKLADRGGAVGELSDLAVDLESGRVLYAVVNANKMMKDSRASNRRFAVPPEALKFSSGEAIVLDADKTILKGAPKISENESGLIGKESFVFDTYDHFNIKPWWSDSGKQTGGDFKNPHLLSKVLKMEVQNVQSQNLGQVENVVVDLTGARLIYVVLRPAESLNLRQHLMAVPPNGLTLHADKAQLVLDSDEERFAKSPGFKKTEWPDLADSDFAHEVYDFYGKKTYFKDRLTPSSDEDRIPEREQRRRNRN